MEKDKFRSAIAVGMLACSVLLISALFIGCGPCAPPVEPPGCTHPSQAAFYHHQHPSGDTITWYVTPRPANDTIPCPWDSAALCTPDSVKCLDCGYLVYSPPCTHPNRLAFYHHTNTIPPHVPGSSTVTWVVPSDPALGTPVAQPCPVDGDPCQCDSVKCTICGAKL